MARIEFVVIFSVTALYLAVVPRRIWSNELVFNAKLRECILK